jgi:hypothetical protein
MGGSCGMQSFDEENTYTVRSINRIWNGLQNSVSTSEKKTKTFQLHVLRTIEQVPSVLTVSHRQTTGKTIQRKITKNVIPTCCSDVNPSTCNAQLYSELCNYVTM